MPRLFAVQPANCGPIAASFLAGTDAEVATPIEPTIAEGTAIAKPIRRREVIAALRDSLGGAVLVSEASIEAALFDLARTGVYVEPTSAQVAAGFVQLLAEGRIGPDETTVLVMTGSGLKATARIAEHIGIAP
jgi:threonine synthase